jgi:hypothetical protein
MLNDGGKGSVRRKEDSQAVRDNWDRIFGKKESPMINADNNDDDYEDECSNEERHEDDEWTCDSCGGPMYSAPHWKYGQCDDCGARQELESDI